MATILELPWASGPGEILRHGLALLQNDSDSNRRLAMISIDNAVELMIKTYLGLPKRINGLKISRRELSDVGESFPSLLDALERHAATKLDGIDLGTIEWYHRLRNELYHQGNGLTVERDKVEAYAVLANQLFRNFFGTVLLQHVTTSGDKLGEFIEAWVFIERGMSSLVRGYISPTGELPKSLKDRQVAWPKRDGKGWEIVNPIAALSFLVERRKISTASARELTRLRDIRNQILHGHGDHRELLTPETLASAKEIARALTLLANESNTRDH